jgi:disulfide oxidoreductase YuzD
MIAFAGMLIPAAEKAGIKCPSDKEVDNWDTEEMKNKYPHFYVFAMVQLGRRMSPGEHWNNAKIIAKISDEDILNITILDLMELGLIYST